MKISLNRLINYSGYSQNEPFMNNVVDYVVRSLNKVI